MCTCVLESLDQNVLCENNEWINWHAPDHRMIDVWMLAIGISKLKESIDILTSSTNPYQLLYNLLGFNPVFI